MHSEKIRKPNNKHDRSIFYIDNIVVADLRHDIAERLRQNDMQHRLPVVHAYGFRPFKLTLVDADDPAANRFCHICSGIDRYDNNADCPYIPEGYSEKVRHTVIDKHSLEYHRRTAENFHINPYDDPYHPKNNPFNRIFRGAAWNCLQNTAEKAYHASDKCRCNRQDQRIEHTGQVHRAVFSPQASYI